MITITDEIRKKAEAKIDNIVSGRYMTKTDVSKKLDITRRTLYNRLKRKNWTGPEIEIILNDL